MLILKGCDHQLLIKLQHCPGNAESDGAICVAESMSSIIPFDIKRVYYSYGAKKGVIRGHHAHKKLQQILICIYGKIEISLDNGKGNSESVILDEPSKGIYVGPSTWRTIKWLDDNSVLLVLASEHYDESDYIRNYNDFVEWRQNQEG